MDNYDHYIVAFSGGKDSTACFLHLLDMGIPKDKIELWHHLVDGREGSTLMDYPVTEDYCKKFAEAFGVKIFFSWKTGGFEREMLRERQLTAPNRFEYLKIKDKVEYLESTIPAEFKNKVQEFLDKKEMINFMFNDANVYIYDNSLNKTPTSAYPQKKGIFINLDVLSDVPKVMLYDKNTIFIDTYYAYLHELSHLSDPKELPIKMADYHGWDEYINSPQEKKAMEFADKWLNSYVEDSIIECGISGGLRGEPGTRLKFPQISPDLRVRWCSAYLKIDVCTAAINNQPRFHHKKTVVISGERAEESAARAKYKEMEPDRSDNRAGIKGRYVDHWRPVHLWSEKQVWDIIERYRVNPHPAYRMGWGRLSCMFCIFGNSDQWKSAKTLDQIRFNKIATYERRFGVTIKRNDNIIEIAYKGTPYKSITPYLMELAKSKKFTEPILIDNWILPAGAFGDETGPT